MVQPAALPVRECPVCGGTSFRWQRGCVAVPYECVVCAKETARVLPLWTPRDFLVQRLVAWGSLLLGVAGLAGMAALAVWGLW